MDHASQIARRISAIGDLMALNAKHWDWFEQKGSTTMAITGKIDLLAQVSFTSTLASFVTATMRR